MTKYGRDFLKKSKALLNPMDVNAMTCRLWAIHPRFGLMWKIGQETGLRITDLLNLQLKTVMDEPFWVTERKNGNKRRLSLSEETRVEIMDYADKYGLSEDNYIFFSSLKNKNKPMSRQWAHRRMASIASQEAVGRVSPHSMRRMYACTQFLKSGASESVQKEMGHRYCSTTLIYLEDLLKQLNDLQKTPLVLGGG
jgi:integrase